MNILKPRYYKPILNFTVPEAPYFSDYDVTVDDYTNYNSYAIIDWGLPCQSNGQLSHFVVTVEGTSTYDSGTFYLSEDTEVNSDSITNYTKTIDGLNASYTYVIDITAVLTSGGQGENARMEFLTSDGCKYTFFGHLVFEEIIVNNILSN